MLVWYDFGMKLVVKLKLNTDKDSDLLLRETTEQYRLACNYISEVAFTTNTFNPYDLHHLIYYTAKSAYSLP